jgi:uncharacterized protein
MQIKELNIEMIQQLHIELPNIIAFARSQYDQDDLHGIGHIERTLENARRLHRHEGGYWDLIETIVWLHDIGRRYEHIQGRHHALISVEMAQKFLNTTKISSYLLEIILNGIQGHSFSIGQKVNTIEGQIVSDADKLDAIGAVGIFRTCVYQASKPHGINLMLDHMAKKLLILDKELYLPISIQIAKERISRMLKFREQLLEELGSLFDPSLKS